MKPTVHKSTTVPFGNHHLLLIGLVVKFMRLAQMDQINGVLLFTNHESTYNHFGLLTIYLVLEDHEMTC